jgi:uncharacterized protein (TIGR03382 family)
MAGSLPNFDVTVESDGALTVPADKTLTVNDLKVKSGGDMSVSTGSTLTVKGELETESDATVINNGKVYADPDKTTIADEDDWSGTGGLPQKEPATPSGGSGGGCSAGAAGIIPLALAGVLALRKKRAR